MSRVIPFITNSAWAIVQQAGHARFKKALADPKAAQKAVLMEMVHQNADSAFGKAHRLDQVGSFRAFQKHVPLSDYAGLEPYIQKVAAGEPNILTCEPVTRLATTSGSTQAKKLIPYTVGLQRQFSAAIAPWVVDLFHQTPGLITGPAYWSITPIAQQAQIPAPDNNNRLPIGFEEDSQYLGGVGKRLVDLAMAVPSAIRHIDDMDTFRYATLRFLLACEHLRLVSVWHPSFLTLLLDEAKRHWPTLLRDIHDGTLTAPTDKNRLGPNAARSLEILRSKVGKNPARARLLEAAGPVDAWTRVWPNLRLISAWADGHAHIPASELSTHFPGVHIQPKGLLATEAFVSIPFEGHWPVAINSHFFEFIDDGGETHLTHELQVAAEYGVAVTTGGGLWRYRLGDRVRVEGFIGKTPSIRFIGRNDGVSDHRGEKLSEGFVGQVLRTLFTELGIRPLFSILAAEASADTVGYTLFLQADAPLPGDLAQRLDQALSANPHYDYCRRLGQLAPVRVFEVHGSGYERYTRACGAMRMGDIKPAALSGRLDLRKWFESDSASCRVG